MERDETVYDIVESHGPISVADVAEKASIVHKDDAFISLVTLEDDGRVEQTDDDLWEVTEG